MKAYTYFALLVSNIAISESFQASFLRHRRICSGIVTSSIPGKNKSKISTCLWALQLALDFSYFQ